LEASCRCFALDCKPSVDGDNTAGRHVLDNIFDAPILYEKGRTIARPHHHRIDVAGA
jgi:hypothetical protein